MAVPVLSEKFPQLTHYPSSLSDDTLKELGFEISAVFHLIANGLP